MVRRRLGKPCQPIAHPPGRMHLALKNKIPQHLHLNVSSLLLLKEEKAMFAVEREFWDLDPVCLLPGVALKGQISGTSLCYWFLLACSAFLPALHTSHSIHYQ